MSKEELKTKHEQLHYLVEKLEQKHFLNDDESMTLKRLKKEKLRIKDQLLNH
jgi:uncharacterized protein YdcH (DUF465 family)